MNKNKNLKAAKKNKNDEFYTRLEDIEKELRFYDFKDMIVYCNCDDYRTSNFYNYFFYNFNYLGIKKLITTCYIQDGKGLFSVYDGVELNTGELQGDGDFRSEECIEYLKQADVVVTNPPFSLFREFIAQLMEYNKKFIVIGNTNVATYKEIFPLIKNNQLWVGVTNYNVGMHFYLPDNYEDYKLVDENGKKIGRVSTSCWWTNIENKRRNEPIDLYKRYSFEDYPKYDNYDAIDVGNYQDIPMDYDGVMGVPITFLGHYCPTQFEIIKFRKGDDDKDLSINGKCPYFRILIRKLS